MPDQFHVFSSLISPARLPERHLGNRRLVHIAIGGVIAIVIGLLTAEPFFFTATASTAGINVSLSGDRASVADLAPAAFDMVSAPVVEANPRFFFGTGDNSAGFYAERPIP